MHLQLAKNCGISKKIIDYAYSLLDKKDIDMENLLKKIYDDKLQIEKQKEETQKNLNQIELLKKNLQRDDKILREKETELINNAKMKARDILLDAKDEASNLIKKMKQIEAESKDIEKLNALKNNINLSIKENSISASSKVFAINPIDKNKIKPGLKVYVTNFSKNGIVLSNLNKNNDVQVQIGNIKTNVNINCLEIAKNLKNDLNLQNNTSNFAKVSKTRTAKSEINVIGLNVDEALPIVDKFIDDCILAKLPTARIVHGKGTGKLRNAIHSYLNTNKNVKSFRIGTFGEGEMGVTVVELK